MKKLIGSILMMMLLGSIRAQDTLISLVEDGEDLGIEYSTATSVNAELGGNGGIYSFNFQRHIPNRFKLPVHWSAGLSVFPRGSLITLSVPVSVNYQLYRKSGNAFVFGTGQTLILSNSKGGYIRGTFRIGYRWEFFRKYAWYLEAAYTPFYSYFYNFQWDNWFGVSFGYYLNSRGS